jgi:hypothetical protein
MSPIRAEENGPQEKRRIPIFSFLISLKHVKKSPGSQVRDSK